MKNPSNPPRLEQTPQNWQTRYEALALQTHYTELRHFYQAGTVDENTPLKHISFVAMDFETTGLDPDEHGIVSIGLIPFTLQRIRMKDAWHCVVKPRRPLEEASIAFHGITHSEIADAPDLMDILATLLQKLQGYIPVVHYNPIERIFLDTALRRRIHEGIEFPVIDTMDIEARLHRGPITNFVNKFRPHKRVSIRLHDSRARYGLPFYPAHHALTDAIATAELLIAQVAHLYSPDTPIKELWV